ncbi:TolC family protein [Longimicrobium terrae]|uniref:Outer membrane protein TolC n=1 Tax=Longimicrobium terrae TaxID=1639882 RepID=A0A841H0P3_9BACT|nr:TolC family protein [Longimicrobium terrae]MBB4637162.1 outer membrane protein TolC [Longimicrobium terrae]MBB6071577.1 outer membrane protein TolC [Longimicrobium terrae]NNC30004.1 TolC family protein [Longimicrobium terrae]
MSAFHRRGRFARGAALLGALLAALPAAAQQPAVTVSSPAPGARPLTLDEALRLAEDASETVQIARAGVTRARGDVLRARSERLPQLNGSLNYSRALASEFQSLGGGGGSDTTTAPAPACGRFAPNPSLPVAERLDSLEAAVNCAQNSNPFAAFSDLPFGRENTWQLGLSFSQSIFNGGRTAATNRIADAGRARAAIELNAQRAQLALDVTQAYYDAALSDRLVTIAEATLQQSETTLQQTRLARQVGNTPEFELLRAQVQRDNQLPLVIQRRADRDLAYSRLALLLDLPAGASLALTSPLDDSRAVPVARFAADEALLGDTTVENRAPVQQAITAVSTQESALRIARSQRLPTIAVTSQYGRVAYPTGAFPSLGDFRSNWTVGAGLTIPIFTGGRIRGDELVAEANLLESRARLRQVQDAARLDTRNALERLEQARAQYQASAGTVEQAARAYSIAEVRYREGISTQVELADSRILLQQAQANRAVAARDLQIAQARAALLPFLPLGTGQTGQSPQQQMQQQQTTPARPQQQGSAASQANAFTGGVQ